MRSLSPPGPFARAVGVLFARGADAALVDELTDLIVDTVEPRVRFDPRFRQKLAPCVAETMDWLRELGARPLRPLLLARGAWDSDPRLNAFFGSAEDIPALMRKSKDLQVFFGRPAHAALPEAYAVLGMRREEKAAAAPHTEDGLPRKDVASTIVRFAGHRLVAPAATEQEVRLEVGRRIIVRLAQVALGRILEIERQGLASEQRKAYLAARLRFLHLARDGLAGLVEEPGALKRQIARAQADLDQAVAEYIATRATLVTLDGYIAQIEAVFGRPQDHVALAHTPLGPSPIAVALPAGSEDDRVLTVAELRVGDRLTAAVAFVRCPRAELPSRRNGRALAERLP